MSDVELEHSLPRSAYVDADVFDLERTHLFAKNWTCIGRHDHIDGAAGSYRLVDLQGENVLVVRGADGALRAFANVCRHRGSELVDSTDPAACSGAFGAVIRCPYHSWTYNIDGTLRGAPYLADLDHAEHGLIQLELDVWRGWVFVRQVSTGGGGLLADAIGVAVGRMANYPLDDLVVGASIRYEVAANWKVLAENYNECYHCGPVHPELCDLVPVVPAAAAAATLEWERGIPPPRGCVHVHAPGTTTRAPFPASTRTSGSATRVSSSTRTCSLSLSCDHVASFVLTPRGAGRTTIEFDLLFHPDEIADPGFDPSDAFDFWDLVNRQDWAICESVQRGMASRALHPGLVRPDGGPEPRHSPVVSECPRRRRRHT